MTHISLIFSVLINLLCANWFRVCWITLLRVFMKCVFLLMPSSSDDAEKWRLQYHVPSRFIRSEFFYFWAAQSFLCLRNFPFSWFPPVAACWGCYYGTLWIIVWCCVPAGYKFSRLLPTWGGFPRPQRRTGTVLTPHSSLRSAEVVSVNQILTSGSFRSEVQPKYSSVWDESCL